MINVWLLAAATVPRLRSASAMTISLTSHLRATGATVLDWAGIANRRRGSGDDGRDGPRRVYSDWNLALPCPALPWKWLRNSPLISLIKALLHCCLVPP